MCKNIQQSRELKIDAPTQQPPVHMVGNLTFSKADPNF